MAETSTAFRKHAGRTSGAVRRPATAGSTQVFAVDAVTILDQIEGALAYLDTTGTRAQTARYKRMRLTLTAAYRKLHNRLHHLGHNHAHTPVTDHKEHQ